MLRRPSRHHNRNNNGTRSEGQPAVRDPIEPDLGPVIGARRPRRCLPVDWKLVWLNTMTAAIVALYFIFVIGVFALMFWLGTAHGHDLASWIQDQGRRNAVGEWCCGDGDCFTVRARHVSLPAPGYRIVETGEFVPEAEAQPSPDGAFWRCHRPDGSRRCFFAPPESN